MLTTKAYSRYKIESTRLLDFAVLVAHAVPALRNEISQQKTGLQASLLPPDFFAKSNRSTPDELLAKTGTYESRLAAYLLLAHFSFFESYVVDILKELIAFHGGDGDFSLRIKTRLKQYMPPHDIGVATLKRKLQDSEKPHWRQRYRKYARELAAKQYRFPGELLAAYGTLTFVRKVQNLRASEIPDLLQDCLLMDLSQGEIKAFERVRKIRNKIAHGQAPPLRMRESVKMNSSIRNLAIRISNHLTENFFVLEKYAP